MTNKAWNYSSRDRYAGYRVRLNRLRELLEVCASQLVIFREAVREGRMTFAALAEQEAEYKGVRRGVEELEAELAHMDDLSAQIAELEEIN